MQTRSWYRKYFITYCLISIIPVVLLGVIICINTVHANRDAAAQQYQRAIVQVASHMDAIMEDMQQTVQHFEDDAEVSVAISNSNPSLLERYLPGYLATTEKNSKIRLQAMYYFIGDKMLYTSEGPQAYETVKRNLSEYVDLDYSNFFTQIVTSSSIGSWQLSKWENGRIIGTDLMAFTFPFPSYSLSHSGTFIFLININDLKAIFADYLDLPLDYLFLYSAKYNLIGSSEAQPQNEEMRKQLLSGPVYTLYEKNISGDSYSIMRYKTNIFGIQIISGIRRDLLSAGATASLQRSLLLIVLCTFLAIVSALLLSRYSYKPVQRLMKIVPNDGNIDEFMAIHQHLDKITANMETMEERGAVVLPIVHDQLMMELLRGKENEWLLETLQYTYPDFCSAVQYFVILTTAAEPEDGQLHGPLYLPGVHAVLYGVLVEETGLAAFIATRKSNDDVRIECMKELASVLDTDTPPYTVYSAGSTVSSTSQISTSYLEAYVAMRKKQNTTSDRLYVYNSLEQRKGSDTLNHKSLDDTVALYLQSLQSVDESTALSLLEAVEETLCANGVSVLYRHFTYVEIFSRAMEAVPESTAARFREEVTNLNQFSTPELFSDIMHRLTSDACREQSQKRKNLQLSTRRQILELVEAHFTEPDFALTTLSRMAGYSSTYVNRCLREEVGMSFIQLVSEKRMNKAKEMLRDTDIMVKDITQQVGYFDAASFVRKFKETEGLTPSEYRIRYKEYKKQK